jgi:outer membrane protein assembly factor BamD
MSMLRLGRTFGFAVALACACATFGGTLGCDNNQPKNALTYTQDAKKAYEDAMEEFRAHNWIDAQSMFREVKRKYSYSKYAKLSELRIADADFEQEKYVEAIREYRQFVHDHRADTEDVGYARSRIAEAQYKQISESILLPSADERDQATTLDAYKEIKGYLVDYGSSKDADKIKELLADVTARLIRHELYVARFYLNKDNYDAAVARIEYALHNFAVRADAARSLDPKTKKRASADTSLAPSALEAEALLLLGETYLKMHQHEKAKVAFEVILREYPESGFTIAAQNYLDAMKRG